MTLRLSRWILIPSGILLAAAAAYFGAVALRWRVFAGEPCRLTPLMFHAVVGDKRAPARYHIRESDLVRELAELRDAGATTPAPDSILAWLSRKPGSGGCPFPPRAVVITFDLDGPSQHVRRALPALTNDGFTGVFFVPTMALDHPGLIQSAGVTALAQGGMTVGSHTEHHYDLRFEQPDSMVASILRTRDTLSALTGRPIQLLAAPGGRYNDVVVANLPRAGIRLFFTSDPCYITPDTDPLRLCRIEIRGDEGMRAVDALESPWRVAVQATNWAMKRLIERILGERVFNLLHAIRSGLGGSGY